MFTGLFTQCLQMDVVHIFGQGHMHLVPPGVCGFIAADQQDGAAPGIKCIQHSIRPAGMLDPQFPQVAMPGTLDITGVGEAQPRPEKPQQIDAGRYRDLLLCAQLIPPLCEFIRVFNVPAHANMPSKEYKLKGIL
ncbi:hypothetical protein AOA59_18670 [Pseudomonas sp. 2822-15]|nr:hypothetical protein AOA59_18670 [Pseudomonas sp. 2822-15]